MKYIYLAMLAAMLCFSYVAWEWQPETPEGRVVLKWVCDDAPIRREQIAGFNESQSTYWVQLDPQKQGMEKVIVQCLGGNGPDMFDCYNSTQLMAFVRSDIAMDVTDELAARGVDVNTIWPCLKPVYTFNGRVYGHPGNANAPAIWYNKRLFREAGVPFPPDDWTWEAFIEIAKKLTKRDEKGRPVQFGFIGPWDISFYEPCLKQWGANFFTPEGTRCTLDSPQAIAALQFMQDLIYEHKIMPTPSDETAMTSSGGWGAGALTLFGAQKGAMAVGGRWWLLLFRNPDFSAVYENLGAAPLPKGPTDTLLGGGRATLVNRYGRNVEGALQFLTYLHGKTFNDIVNRWADAVPAVKTYCYDEAFLFNPDYPKEDFHQVFRDAVEKAVAMDISPYVNGATVTQIMVKQTDLVKLGQKSAGDAMRSATEQINEAIVAQLTIDSTLKKQYYEALEKGALPAWESGGDAP